MKPVATKMAQKMDVSKTHEGSIPGPVAQGRTNEATRRDFDLPQLQHMLVTISERRANARAILDAAEAELSALSERESCAHDVLQGFDARGEQLHPNITQAKTVLEDIEENRLRAQRRAECGRNLLAEADRRAKEFPRDLYERLLREDRDMVTMRSR